MIIEPFIDVGGEVVKAFVHGFEAFVYGLEAFVDVGGEVVKAFVHGVEAFVDVDGEVVEAFINRIEAFGHGFKANIHRALEPINL